MCICVYGCVSVCGFVYMDVSVCVCMRVCATPWGPTNPCSLHGTEKRGGRRRRERDGERYSHDIIEREKGEGKGVGGKRGGGNIAMILLLYCICGRNYANGGYIFFHVFSLQH